MKLLLRTRPGFEELAIKDLKLIGKIKGETIDKGIIRITVNNEELENIIFLSRFIDYVYLEILVFKDLQEIINKRFSNIKLLKEISEKAKSFEVDVEEFNYERFKSKDYFGEIIRKELQLKVNLDNPDLRFVLFSSDKNYLGLDLAEQKLTKRWYKLNKNSLTPSTLLPNLCFYKLGLETTNFSLLDPLANYGEFIIEAALFNPRQPIKIKPRKIHRILNIKTPYFTKQKSKLHAVVQDNGAFKKLKENLKYVNAKIKVSMFDLEWLDTKFAKDSFEYAVFLLPIYKDEKHNKEIQETLFYNLEYIIKNKICFTATKPIEESIINKYNLKIESVEEIKIGEQNYYIYLLSKTSST